jgi:hypothetical protein
MLKCNYSVMNQYKMAFYFMSACKPQWWHLGYHDKKPIIIFIDATQ